MNAPRRRIYALLVASSLLAAAPAPAQFGPQGPWDNGVQYYVSTTGSNANPGTLAQPFQTIGFAVATAMTQIVAGTPVTVDLLPGTYGPNELFPISLPARGLALEAYAPGVQIDEGSFSFPALEVNVAGPPASVTAPGTIIHGVLITRSQVAISIQSAYPQETKVEVRNCELTQNGTGMRIDVFAGSRDESVIEHNEIHANGFIGVRVTSDGECSTLIRSNRIHDQEINVFVVNTAFPAVPDDCQPRLQSNFVWAGETQVYLDECSPWVVNNTIAYARPFSAVPQVFGVVFNSSAGVMTLANNIVWNPSPGPGVVGVDLSLGGTAIVDTNDFENALTFVGTNGNISVVPGFVSPAPPYDLHLLPASPLIEIGNNAFVQPPLQLAVGSQTVRADLGIDVDTEPRAIDFDKIQRQVVDIGGDEVVIATLSVTAGADPLGNMISGGGTVSVTLQVLTRPGDRVGIYQWNSQTFNPNVVNRWKDPLGNLLLDITTPGASIVLASGNANAAGIFTATFTTSPAAFAYESEWFFQGLATIHGTPLGDYTNRIRLELQP